MVAYIRELGTTRHHWLGDDEFKRGVALCQSVPGPIAMHAAAYVGLKARGLGGAMLTYVAFGLPAFLFMLVLSIIYSSTRELPGVIAIFDGLQVIVVAIVAVACYGFGRDTLKSPFDVLMAAGAGGLLLLGVSPVIVVAGAALLGIVAFRSLTLPSAQSVPASQGKTVSRLLLFRPLVLLLPLGLALLVLYVLTPSLFHVATPMMKINLLAFGGGFGAIPIAFHEVVEVRGWLDNQTFIDGLALGQVTPGPVVMTATFIGYLTEGLPGALVATTAILAPSFILLVTIAPLFDRFQSSLYFQRAIRGILVSFVGLLLFVTIKFGLDVPWDPLRAMIGAAALVALIRRVDILYVVLTGAVLSFILFR
jgi:chromate transporter